MVNTRPRYGSLGEYAYFIYYALRELLDDDVVDDVLVAITNSKKRGRRVRA